eukprot:2468769-Pyramimonas_sp.AAC.1
MYNLLPESVVSAQDVIVFQRLLSALLCYASGQVATWPQLFSCRLPLAFHEVRRFRNGRPAA